MTKLRIAELILGAATSLIVLAKAVVRLMQYLSRFKKTQENTVAVA